MSTKKVGDIGEKLACEYLVKNGYKVIGKNYRINFGEIDIITKKRGLFADKTIHFVEVKMLKSVRPDTFQQGGFYPEDHVNFKKRQKLRQLAEIWLSKNKYPQDIPYQIDVIAVMDEKIDFFENTIAG